MSNNFPALPSDLEIQSVEYLVNFTPPPSAGVPPTILTPGAEYVFDGVSTGIFGALAGLGNPGGIVFSFNTPGNAGSFDQTTAEANLVSLATDVMTLMSTLTGVPVTTLMQNFSVKRVWTWTDAAGNTATYTDTMAIPNVPA